MTVVRNEFERGENDPDQCAHQRSDAAPISRIRITTPPSAGAATSRRSRPQKLRDFYDTFYWPNNATVSIVGDFDPADALGLVKKFYGGYPNSPHRFRRCTPKSRRRAARAASPSSAPAQLGTVIIAFKAPSGLDADIPALNVLGCHPEHGQEQPPSRRRSWTSRSPCTPAATSAARTIRACSSSAPALRRT